jgi:hypothetical protein
VSALATTLADVAAVSRALTDVHGLLDRLAAGLVLPPRLYDRRVQQTVAVERRCGTDRRRGG